MKTEEQFQEFFQHSETWQEDFMNGLNRVHEAIGLATMPLGVRDDLAEALEKVPYTLSPERKAIVSALAASLRRPPDPHADGTPVGTVEEEAARRDR